MKILFATSNENKIAEARSALGSLGHTVEQLLIDGHAPDFIEPQADDIEVISKSKIQQSLELISGTEFEGCAVLVEDSGLFINSLDNFPGVYSSYVSKTIGNEGIIKILKGNLNRKAEYRAYSIIYENGNYWHSMGICLGEISTKILGSNGFGFDPIFIPDSGDGRTFGEMLQSEKDAKSHRGESLRILCDELKPPSK
jgi:XTP/dITP diphosphohydrolase|tara:strand:+ start:691 stop:1284 length:594 start_codon:yes stop_codon:yes gene_type:complete